MPNWCSTDINIHHDDETKLKELFDRIKEWTSKDYCENGFGHNWLGNVVGNSGIGDWKKISCRGSISDINFDGEWITIFQDDAWSPNIRLWEMVCEKYLPDATILYTAEEPGCGIYETNDPDIAGYYYVDGWDVPEEFQQDPVFSESTASEEEVIAFCQKVLKTDETDVEKLLDMVSELDWVSIHQWEYADCY